MNKGVTASGDPIIASQHKIHNSFPCLKDVCGGGGKVVREVVKEVVREVVREVVGEVVRDSTGRDNW